MKRILSLAALLAAFVLLPAANAAAAEPDFEAMIREVDKLQDFTGLDFSGVFTIASEKPGEKQSVQQIRMFRRDAKKQFLILIQLPEAQKGQGYLKEDDNVWFYDPTSRKFTHSSVKENLSDSEAKNSDFTNKSILEDYAIEKTEPGVLGKFPIWIVTLKAKTGEVSYDRMKLSIRQDKTLVLKEEDFGASGRLMRTTLFPKYAEVAPGKFFPSQMLLIDEINKGEKSQVTMSELSVERLPDKVFTKAFIEQVN
ncbi:MAG: outer membrane lipoprotein-sorting protein [Spirochaetaceae bacterium]|nr:outer membrane lipoprotein-sorting protein [Spirochaetaceae bacterium]